MSIFQPFDPDDEPSGAPAPALRRCRSGWCCPAWSRCWRSAPASPRSAWPSSSASNGRSRPSPSPPSLDGIDGRVARFLKSTVALRRRARIRSPISSISASRRRSCSTSGRCDDAGSLGWIAALIFAICARCRLARFNVAMHGPDKPEWQSEFFVGVPAPAGGDDRLAAGLSRIHRRAARLPTAPLVIVYTLAIAHADGEPGADLVGRS